MENDSQDISLPLLLTHEGRLISKDNERMFSRHGRPMLSSKFRGWAEDKACEARNQYRGKPLKIELEVHIVAYYRTKVHVDCFNAPKGYCDALEGIVYNNDRQIKYGTVHVVEDKTLTREYFKVVIAAYDKCHHPRI